MRVSRRRRPRKSEGGNWMRGCGILIQKDPVSQSQNNLTDTGNINSHRQGVPGQISPSYQIKFVPFFNFYFSWSSTDKETTRLTAAEKHGASKVRLAVETEWVHFLLLLLIERNNQNEYWVHLKIYIYFHFIYISNYLWQICIYCQIYGQNASIQ